MPDWLDGAIETFNYPEEMGERVEDSASELEESLRSAESSHQRALGQLLLAELRSYDAQGDPSSPYTLARRTSSEPADLELFHHLLGEWVARADLEARRSARPSASQGSDPVALWERFGRERAESALSMEDDFRERTGRYLTHVASDLNDVGRHELAEAIALEVLARGAKFPGHWWEILAGSRLARAADARAEEAIAQAILWENLYEGSKVALLYRFLEQTGAAPETLRAVYHGGGAIFHKLKGAIRKRPPGEKESNAKTAFAELYRDWVQKVWRGAAGYDTDFLLHVSRLFDTVGKRALKTLRAEVDAELARRR